MNNLITVLVIIYSIAAVAFAEIKHVNIAKDSRPLILFEKFGFSSNAAINIAVSGVTFSNASVASTDLSLFGFFLISSSNLLQALYSQQSENPSCILSSPYIRLLFTFRDLSPPPFSSYNRNFPVALADHYSLFFANCVAGSEVSMSITTVLYNSLPDGSPDYLSVGEAPIPTVCFVFALIYIALCASWFYFGLVKRKRLAHRIHYLMAVLLIAKALNLVFKGEEWHYVRTTGSPHGWDVLFYLFQFIKGVLLFAVIVLIGTGWLFLKPFLQGREKKVLVLVVPLQVVINVASIVIGEMGRFMQDWDFWMRVLLLVDALCCCMILLPIVWSIRSLRETSKTDGKAARNLLKLLLFRRFYLLVIGYLYFTRMVLFAMRIVFSYKWKWGSLVVEKGVTLAFYLSMYYMFRPKAKNEYFALDDENEAAAVVALREQEFEI